MQYCHLEAFFELAFSDIFDPPCVMRKYDAMLRFFPVGGHAEEEEGNGMREIYPSFPSCIHRTAAYLALVCAAAALLILIISHSRGGILGLI